MCQIKVAVEAQLDPKLRRAQRLKLLAKPARKITYWQRRNATARRAHRKSALRKWRRRGIKISILPSCVCRL